MGTHSTAANEQPSRQRRSPETTADGQTPYSERDAAKAPGHWLLARLGKRVLRPGGLGLTLSLLQRAGISNADVVELAPGLGRTATEIIAIGPSTYVGVEKDEDAAALARRAVGDHGRVEIANAKATGLPDACADVVIAEAMLTMQSPDMKRAIVAEAARLLRPGGRYAIHELGLQPDEISPEIKAQLSEELARTIRVNARPLTLAEWRELLQDAGLEVQWTETAPMALLQMRRNIADEGLFGTLRIIRNVLRDGDTRKRVLSMRALFARYSDTLCGVALVARRPA